MCPNLNKIFRSNVVPPILGIKFQLVRESKCVRDVRKSVKTREK